MGKPLRFYINQAIVENPKELLKILPVFDP